MVGARVVASGRLRITWVKSAIGYSRRQKGTIRALGLRALGQTVVKEDHPSIRGMVKAVEHLVRVEEAEEGG
jgi:large subunit ribosomal protein L30